MKKEGMFVIRKQFKFELAHQLSQAFTRGCWATIHGHSYLVEFYFESPALNETDLGMVIDFGRISKVMKGMIDKWDHALMMPDTSVISSTSNHYLKDWSRYLAVLQEFNEHLILVPWNPTAERMAFHLYHEGSILLANLMTELNTDHSSCGVRIKKVRIHETATGWAEYEA